MTRAYPLWTRADGAALAIFWSAFAVFVLQAGKGWRLPYGRFASAKTSFPVPARVAWFLLHLPGVVLPLGALAECVEWTNSVILSLLLLHNVQGCLLYALRIRQGTPMPLLALVGGVAMSSLSAWVQSAYHCELARYPANYLWSLRSLAALTLFFLGGFIHMHSNAVLRSLRPRDGAAGQAAAYRVPKGGLFRLASCPQHFGHMVQAFGWAFLCDSFPAHALFWLSVFVLGPRSMQIHQWYRARFPDYPRNRAALVPYIL